MAKSPPPLKKSILTLICFYSIALFPRLSSDCPLLHPLLFLYKHAAGYIVYILFYFTPSPISICTDPVLGSFDRNRIYTYQIHKTLCDISTFHGFFYHQRLRKLRHCAFSLRLCSDKPRWWINIHQWLNVKINNLKNS